MSDSFKVESFTLLGIGLGIIGLRWYVRTSTVGIRGLKADDYLMVLVVVSATSLERWTSLAWLTYSDEEKAAWSIEAVLRWNVGARWHGLANNGMTDQQRAVLSPESQEYKWRVNGCKTQLMGWAAYPFQLWCLKAAMCAFYLRLTEGLKRYHFRIYLGFVLIVASWIILICTVMLTCRPFHKNWQINPDPGSMLLLLALVHVLMLTGHHPDSCQPAVSKANLFTMVLLNVGTDIYLLIIPMPMFWTAHIPLRKKLGLILLFSGGIFVTTAGVLRCVLILAARS